MKKLFISIFCILLGEAVVQADGLKPAQLLSVGIGYAPFTYRVQNPNIGFNDSVKTRTFSFMLSDRYRLAEHWDISGQFEIRTFPIYDNAFGQIGSESLAHFGSHTDGWIYSIGTGFELRGFSSIALSGTGSAQSILSRSLFLLGLPFEAHASKDLNDFFTLGARVHYFYPLILTGAGDGGKLTRDASNRNLFAEIQATFWVGEGTGLSLAGRWERRSVSYTPGNVTLLGPESVYQDANLIFTRLSFRF